MTDDDDKKVKELIDAATRAELEKWFGLPSFTQVEEEKKAAPEEDPDIVAVRERREKAIAAVDPAMVEAHRRRTDVPEWLFQFKPTIDVRIDPSCALLDVSMIDRGSTVAEPREVEIPEQLRDDMKDCTPQAILRDLHRPELDFEKLFEVHDYAAEGRVDAVAIVDEMMKTSWKLSTIDNTATFREGYNLMRELRANRLADQSAFLPTLPNRRVTD